jgi:pimeloyl-ACP methyl ester carboxylesterase
MRTWNQVSARTLAARLRAIMAVDARAELRGLVQPVLYLASSQDAIVPHRNRDEIARLSPGVQVVTIPGHHQALYSQPRAAADAITAFIAELD